MALVAMSCFKASFSFAQANQPKAFNSQIKTPNTSKELMNDSKPAAKEEVEEKEDPTPASGHSTSSSQRRLHQHGLGLGLGQTFLLGNYAKHGDNKITADLFYSYAASYSFDLLVNAHMSEQESGKESMKLRGLATSIKGRIVEYDNVSPYILGGLGFYAPQAKRNVSGSYKWSDQKATFGVNFGGGLDLRLNDEFVVGILGQMHCPFTVKQDDQPDLKGYYFKLLITAMYLFQ